MGSPRMDETPNTEPAFRLLQKKVETMQRHQALVVRAEVIARQRGGELTLEQVGELLALIEERKKAWDSQAR